MLSFHMLYLRKISWDFYHYTCSTLHLSAFNFVRCLSAVQLSLFKILSVKASECTQYSIWIAKRSFIVSMFKYMLSNISYFLFAEALKMKLESLSSYLRDLTKQYLVITCVFSDVFLTRSIFLLSKLRMVSKNVKKTMEFVLCIC